MLRFGKRKGQVITQPDTNVPNEADQRYAAALLTIIHSRWPNIEDAKALSVQIMLLASVELEKIAPEFRNTYTPVQRAIAAALYVSVSKSGVTHIGKESLIRIVEGTRDFSVHSGEVDFYTAIGRTFHIL